MNVSTLLSLLFAIAVLAAEGEDEIGASAAGKSRCVQNVAT